jgi:phospholipid/cholesterol/gamma-HCH transport system permease protein
VSLPLPPVPPLPSAPQAWLRTLREWWAGWRQVIHFGAQVLVLAISPSSYRRSQRQRIVHAIYHATVPMLPSFTVIAAVIALIIIRIVLATALSYGLTRYALDVLVRTLVLELIPLSAAIFAALRYAFAAGEQVRAMRLQGRFESELAAGRDPTRDTVLPRAAAGLFAVITLAAVSGVITMVLTYVSVYGFALWGLPGFTRTVGHVFNPVIVLIFSLKTFFLGMAVAIVPMVPTPREGSGEAGVLHVDVTRLARLLAVALLIEMVSLVGNYY